MNVDPILENTDIYVCYSSIKDYIPEDLYIKGVWRENANVMLGVAAIFKIEGHSF